MGKNIPFTAYLIKREYTEYDDILDLETNEITGLDIHPSLEISGKAFLGENKEKSPQWDEFLDSMLVDYETQTNQSSRAVLFVRRRNRLIAFTFGYGRHLLKEEAYVRNFGLKVILNNVKRDNIKSIDTTIVDENPFQNRTQASRASSLEEFNLTDIRTMYRSVVAESINEDKYGHTIAGKDSFSFNYKEGFSKLNYLCDHLIDDYENTSYRDKFPEIDKIVEISDPVIIEKLNNQIIDNFKKDENIFLMIPDVIDWAETDGFSYSKKGDVFPAPSIKDFWNNKKIDPDKLKLKQLQSQQLYRMVEGKIKDNWSILKCICTEITYLGKHYIFSIGQWFEIKNDLLKQVDKFINNIQVCDIPFPIINGLHEEDANILFEEKVPGLLNMDQKNMRIYGDKYEVCDLLSSDKKFIHVKWWNSSSTLSHLFSQGRVSGEIIASYRNQRETFNNRVSEINFDFRDIIDVDNYNPENYSVVFAIIYPENKPIVERLPFFSKINLMHAVRELRSLRYNVEIVHIKSTSKRLSKEENEEEVKEYKLVGSM